MNKLTLDQRKFNGLVGNICQNIVKNNWRPDYIVGITRGGLLPAVMISHYFDVKMYTVDVSLRDGDGDCESNLWLPEYAVGYVNEDLRKENGGHITLESFKKNILLVDDINDTGATFNWIKRDWESSCRFSDWEAIWNHNVKFAVVVDNLSSKSQVKMDYCGMEINKSENDVWVDFPYEDWWSK